MAWRWCARTWCVTALPEMTSVDATSSSSCELMEDNTVKDNTICNQYTLIWTKRNFVGRGEIFLSEAVPRGPPAFEPAAPNAEFGMKETFPTTCYLSHTVSDYVLSISHRFRLRVIYLTPFPVDPPRTAEDMSELCRYTVYAMYSTQYLQPRSVSCSGTCT